MLPFTQKIGIVSHYYLYGPLDLVLDYAHK